MKYKLGLILFCVNNVRMHLTDMGIFEFKLILRVLSVYLYYLNSISKATQSKFLYPSAALLSNTNFCVSRKYMG